MNKKALSMPLCFLIATTILMIALPFNVIAQQGITVYVDPVEQTVDVCENFYVYVNIEGVEEPAVYDYDLFLYYDSSLMTPVNAWDGGFLQPPVTFNWEIYQGIVHCWAVTLDGGSIGDGTLAVIEFHCDGPGDSELYPDVMLSDVTGMPFPPDAVIGGFVHQLVCLEQYAGLYWKRNYTDYAPSGMPDFDQKQTGINYTWTNPNPPVGTPSWCGPTALANSFWWFDSKFEPNPIPPPTINDGFPLVQSYGPWDDHAPQNVRYLIEDLAWYIDTDGIRTKSTHCGTEVHEMAKGIDSYLNDKGLSDKFYVHLVKEPEFEYIEEEVYKCQDVVLLLGYWQEDPQMPGVWYRIGGHFVTVAGINSTSYEIGLSDPYLDAAEAGLAPGVVIPPKHIHPVVDPWGLHNNATYVSHDIYTVYGQSPSPGGYWWIPDYPAYELFYQTESYMWGNFPEEFLDFAGELGVGPIHTEIEYAVIVCPWYAKPDYPDYAPSGVPDFDQRQGGTYLWQDSQLQWSHCGPVAVANSLWWLDSEFETSTTPPPTINETFPLVQSYIAGGWDDHDQQNVPWLVEDLAWFMDCDGRRTGLQHSGTYVFDMEAGIAQYLSKVGVNPLGDANGDGVVDQTDLSIVEVAFGSVPGDHNWNLAADLDGDNFVGVIDLELVTTHLGEEGMFYEQTIENPEFYYLEDEFEKCEDVVLLLGFYTETGPGEFYWEGGHYVTWAGVDSEDLMLAISNPIRDEAEQGKWGQIPVPHQHMLPEPPYIMHNDAQYVSHDIYKVAFNPLAGKWELLGYFDPPMHAFFDYAVITSPVSAPDVAVINVTTSKTGCVPMPTVCEGYNAYVNVTVENQGSLTVTFDVTVYANETIIETQTVISLVPSAQTILTFKWNTTGFAKGNYTIKAEAETVAGEIETGDNTFIDGLLKVVIVGDVNGDGIVELKDFFALSQAFGSKPGDPNWNPNADVATWPDGDGIIELKDFFVLSQHFGEKDP